MGRARPVCQFVAFSLAQMPVLRFQSMAPEEHVDRFPLRDLILLVHQWRDCVWVPHTVDVASSLSYCGIYRNT